MRWVSRLSEQEIKKEEIAEPEEKQVNLEVCLVEKEEKILELEDKLLRLQAEFANYRKRTSREKENLITYGSCRLVEQLLPVLDNLERAMSALNEQDEKIQQTFLGLKMIAEQFVEILFQVGLKPIEAVGSEFDPYYHEAVEQVSAEGVPNNQVVAEIRKGYCFQDKVLRVSLVKVAKNE